MDPLLLALSGGALSAYGVGWVVSVPTLAKFYLNPKRHHIGASGRRKTLKVLPGPGATPRTTKAVEQAVEIAYRTARHRAVLWPLWWPLSLSRAQDAVRRARTVAALSAKLLDDRKTALRLRAFRAGLENADVLVAIEEASDEQGLAFAEEELTYALDQLQEAYAPPKPEVEKPIYEQASSVEIELKRAMKASELALYAYDKEFAEDYLQKEEAGMHEQALLEEKLLEEKFLALAALKTLYTQAEID
jgi:hypothetical protein